MTKKEVIKSVGKLVVSFGVGTIVTNAVSFTTPGIPMGVLKRAAIGVGSFVMSAFASDKLSEYTDLKIDEAFSEFEKIMSEKDDVEKEDPAT